MASHGSTTHQGSTRRSQTGGYLPIEDYGLIGNMHTCALVGIDGSVDFMCWCVARVLAVASVTAWLNKAQARL